MKHFNPFTKLSSRIFAMILIMLLLPSIIMMYSVKIRMENLLQEEISERVVQNLQRSENELNNIFSRMVNISTVFFVDNDFVNAFSDESVSYYRRYTAFKKVLSDISMQNLVQLSVYLDTIPELFNITFFDNHGNTYANWVLNFQDYSYLFQQDWMQDNSAVPGFMKWSLNALGYEPGGADVQKTQLALSRTLASDDIIRKSIGTLLITIDWERIAEVLSAYKYNTDDIIFASDSEKSILFSRGMEESLAEEVAVSHSDSAKGSDVISIDGKKYLLSYYTVKEVHVSSDEALKIYYLTDYARVEQEIGRLTTHINLSCILFIGLVLLIAMWISHSMSRPIRALATEMRNYQAGDLPSETPCRRRDEIGEITHAFRGMAHNTRDLLEDLKTEQATKEKYHFESLKAKMSPHFLFNTLTTLRYMAIIRKADNIREGIDSLASILRYSLSDDVEMVPLSRELEVVKDYCEIHNLRTGSRDRLIIQVDENLMNLRIIKFILQPAVENCFKHAFQGENGGDTIIISGGIEENRLIIRVSDNGPGFSEESLKAFRNRRNEHKQPGTGHVIGIGLNIIDERIRLSCGQDCGIEPGNEPDGGATLAYRLSIIKPEEGDSLDEARNDRG